MEIDQNSINLLEKLNNETNFNYSTLLNLIFIPVVTLFGILLISRKFKSNPQY